MATRRAKAGGETIGGRFFKGGQFIPADFILKYEDRTNDVLGAAERAAFRTFSQAAFAIRETAVRSIVRARGPSPPGQPPHTHRGAYLRRAIRYAANREGAVIGPMASVVGTAGQAHEFGGPHRDAIFPERPFMGPALEQNLDRFAIGWSGSISS